MALTHESTPRQRRDDDTDDRTTQPDAVLDLLSDDYVRAIFAELGDGSRSARELVDRCDASKPTVYRRLNRLESAGLVRTRMALHPDGHHRKEFAVDFERLTLDFEGGELTASVDLDAPSDDAPLPGPR